MLGGWGYGAICALSAERVAVLDNWLFHYNHRRRTDHSGDNSHHPPELLARDSQLALLRSAALARSAAIVPR